MTRSCRLRRPQQASNPHRVLYDSPRRSGKFVLRKGQGVPEEIGPRPCLVLTCSSLAVRDITSEPALLSGTFADVANWLYEKYESRILPYRHDPNSAHYRPLIIFTSPSGETISHEQVVAPVVHRVTPIAWKPAFTTRKAFPEVSSQCSSAPQIVEHVFEVAKYVGAAGIGGVIGNRTDAAVLNAFARAGKLWSRRQWSRAIRKHPDALPADAAIDCAKAAVKALFASQVRDHELHVRDQRLDKRGQWRISLRLGGPKPGTYSYDVRIPSGDPSTARISVTSDSALRNLRKLQ